MRIIWSAAWSVARGLVVRGAPPSWALLSAGLVACAGPQATSPDSGPGAARLTVLFGAQGEAELQPCG